jgi:cytochrome c oxidase subunit 2
VNEFLRQLLFLPPQATTVARQIDHLHYFVILTTICGASFITVVGGVFLVKYRRRSDAPAPRPTAAAPLWLEVLIVASLFALFCGWWVIGDAQFVRLRVAPADTLDIYVTAKQWMWRFNYPDGGRAIAQLYVPVGRPVKLLMTSRDVIHSFYVPDFRVKQDVIPGRFTTLWFTVERAGTHQILCAEYCGAGHSTMRGEVIALDAADWARWLRGVETPPVPGVDYREPSVVGALAPAQQLDLARAGLRVAGERGCLRCHTVDGAPHIGPTWAALYRARVPLADGTTVIADEAYLTESMMDPLEKIHAGFAPVMPSYRALLAPEDVAAIVELVKSLRDVRPGAGAPPPRERRLEVTAPVEGKP